MNLQQNLAYTMAALNEAYNDGTLCEYISNALEVEYTKNLAGDLKGVIILAVFGGPNIYINTGTGKIEGFAAGEYDDVDLTPEVAEEIESIVMEFI